MNYSVFGVRFSATSGMATASIAGAMAIGVLLISTVFRMWGVWKKNRTGKK